MILCSPFHVPKPRRCTAAQGPPQGFGNWETVEMPEARRTNIQCTQHPLNPLIESHTLLVE